VAYVKLLMLTHPLAVRSVKSSLNFWFCICKTLLCSCGKKGKIYLVIFIRILINLCCAKLKRRPSKKNRLP